MHRRALHCETNAERAFGKYFSREAPFDALDRISGARHEISLENKIDMEMQHRAGQHDDALIPGLIAIESERE